jgi:hypothetical protein
VGGADTITVSDGGEPLHMGIEQHRKRGRFGLAELRELCGDRLDGAVVLAELGAGSDGVNGGGIPLSRKRTRNFTRIGSGGWIEPGTHPLRQLGSPLLGEGGDGLFATVLSEETEGADS